MEEIKNILLQKKNIILQGAPGTGKTYSSAELALNICGIDTNNLSRKEQMQRYQDLTNSNRIAFVTFHQTMDYDDFIESLKPQLVDGKVTYQIEDGIFKKICVDAHPNSVKTVSNFETSFNKFINVIKDKDSFEIKKEGDDVVFHVSVNSKDNLSLVTGKDTQNGSLTFDQLKMEYLGQGSYARYSYKRRIIQYLKDNYGLKDFNPDENGNKDNSNNNYVLIIDEINRGNISKIFGELISLIESDKREGEDNCLKAKLSYSKDPFSVPSNLYIIGTMNTTDRSVGSIDYAIRRRFAFFTLKSSKDLVEQSYSNAQQIEKQEVLPLYTAVEIYLKNTSVDMDIDDLMVGHSYFMYKKGVSLSQRWKYEILPLLTEYFKDGICSKNPEVLMNDFIAKNKEILK